MDTLNVCLPDGGDDGYEYATMGLRYSRTGSGKVMQTVLAFGDAHGAYPFEVTTKETDGHCHAVFEVEEATITINGEFEANDLINFFRKIVQFHDIQQLVLHGNRG